MQIFCQTHCLYYGFRVLPMWPEAKISSTSLLKNLYLQLRVYCLVCTICLIIIRKSLIPCHYSRPSSFLLGLFCLNCWFFFFFLAKSAPLLFLPSHHADTTHGFKADCQGLYGCLVIISWQRHTTHLYVAQ